MVVQIHWAVTPVQTVTRGPFWMQTLEPMDAFLAGDERFQAYSTVSPSIKIPKHHRLERIDKIGYQSLLNQGNMLFL